MQSTGKTIIDTINAAPEFQKFCAVNGLIELGFTQITKIKVSYGIIKLKFISQFLDREISVLLDSADDSVAEFINAYPKYVAAVEKIAEHEACVAKYDAALAKISALEAEIAELRLRPGGPDYLAAKERFERGYAN